MKRGAKRNGTGPAQTDATQANTFTRRAFVMGAAQGGLGALLAGRMGYIAIAENERYSDLAESNRVHMRLIPPRRGWIIDRYGRPMAVNSSDFRVDLIPDRLEDKDRVVAELARLLDLSAEEVARIREDLAGAAGFQPVPVAEHLSIREIRRGQPAAARTARRVAAARPSRASIPKARRSAT